jgi:hypothetical protein
MCTGVTKGLAGIKFSGSPKAHGAIRQIQKSNPSITKTPNKSFTEK